MKIFFDNNLAPKLARSLHEFVSTDGHEIIHLRDKFAEDTSDVEWLTALATNESDQWIIVSGDMRISRSKVEQEAWFRSGHIIFFLTKGWTNLDPHIQLSKLAKMLPKIIEYANQASPGDGFKIRPKSEQILEMQ